MRKSYILPLILLPILSVTAAHTGHEHGSQTQDSENITSEEKGFSSLYDGEYTGILVVAEVIFTFVLLFLLVRHYRNRKN